jgi:hypothetical protein
LKVTDDRDDPDSEMVSVYSDAISELTTKTADTTNPLDDESTKKSETKSKKQKMPSLDLLERVEGMYRLLDLIAEQGSGGAGEFDLSLLMKIIVDNCISREDYHRAGFNR